MRVEEDRREVGLGARPGHDEDGLALDHLGDVVVQAQPLSLPSQELVARVVVRIGLNRLDPQILPGTERGCFTVICW